MQRQEMIIYLPLITMRLNMRSGRVSIRRGLKKLLVNGRDQIGGQENLPRDLPSRWKR